MQCLYTCCIDEGRIHCAAGYVVNKATRAMYEHSLNSERSQPVDTYFKRDRMFSAAVFL